MNENTYDVIIIGAGPVGLYTGYYCGLRKLRTLICDSLDYPGGQLYNLYPEKIIYDLPGYESITAKGFIGKLEGQLEHVTEYVSMQMKFTVVDVKRLEDESFKVSSKDETLYAKAIILAMGNGSFVPRTLGLSNESEFTNISYYVSEVNAYKDKDVVIFGGGDSAVDWSLMLEPVAKSVSVIHRRPEFRAKQGQVETMMKSTVDVLVPYVPLALEGANSKVNRVLISETKTDEVKAVACEQVIVSYGTLSAVNHLEDWQVALENRKVVINQKSETSIPGLFACGDVTGYPGRQIQIISGLAEGMMASASAYDYLMPSAKPKPIR